MRYGNASRGIIRTTNTAFPTAITMDVCTSTRYTSVKFTQTMKITGPPNYQVAKETVDIVLNKIRMTQNWLNFIAEHPMEFSNAIYALETNTISEDPIVNQIYSIITIFTKNMGKNKALKFANDFLSKFNGILYTGELTYDRFYTEMVNIPFELGFTIHERRFAEIMKRYMTCEYSNVKTTSRLSINLHYLKTNRKKENGLGRYTFQINKSGYIVFSGLNRHDMKPLYNLFMKIVLENLEQLQSKEEYRRNLKINGGTKCYSLEEWQQKLQDEEEIRQEILSSNYTIEDIIKNTNMEHGIYYPFESSMYISI